MKNFEMKKITYLSDQAKDYQEQLNRVETYEDLTCLLLNYETICWDALDLAKEFSRKRFEKFKKALHLERRGKFSNNCDAMVIIMPSVMFKVSIVANKFNAPWGCAFIRLTEVGKLKNTCGRYEFVEESC